MSVTIRILLFASVVVFDEFPTETVAFDARPTKTDTCVTGCDRKRGTHVAPALDVHEDDDGSTDGQRERQQHERPVELKTQRPG